MMLFVVTVRDSDKMLTTWQSEVSTTQPPYIAVVTVTILLGFTVGGVPMLVTDNKTIVFPGAGAVNIESI
jgi:hypothetical protein